MYFFLLAQIFLVLHNHPVQCIYSIPLRNDEAGLARLQYFYGCICFHLFWECNYLRCWVWYHFNHFYLYTKGSIVITKIKEIKSREQHCPRCETNILYIHKRGQDSYSVGISIAGNSSRQDRQTGRMPQHHEPRSRYSSRVRWAVRTFWWRVEGEKER